MPLRTHRRRLTLTVALAVAVMASAASAQRARPSDAYQPPSDQAGLGTLNSTGGQSAPAAGSGYGPNTYGQRQTYQPQTYQQDGGAPVVSQGAAPSPYGQPPRGFADSGSGSAGGGSNGGGSDVYRAQREDGYGQPYSPPVENAPPRADDRPARGYYEQGEIVEKGKGFFGSIAQGLASAIEYTYAQAGRPNGYILGEDGGGAFFGGLRYGQGTLYTKDAGDHKVYWQGPSLGWDVGGEGSKVMVLVYNLSQPGDMFHRYGGVEGSTYVVGGVSVQFQKHDDVTLAVIRSGVGLRLGVNVGYLKYTREPTINPF